MELNSRKRREVWGESSSRRAPQHLGTERIGDFDVIGGDIDVLDRLTVSFFGMHLALILMQERHGLMSVRYFM